VGEGSGFHPRVRASSIAGSHRPDIVVIGAGIVGALAAWRLRVAGHRVLLICAPRIPGGTAASMAVVRTTCDEPVLAAESLAWYRSWSATPAWPATFVGSGVAIVLPRALSTVVGAAARVVNAHHPGAGARAARPQGRLGRYVVGDNDWWFEPLSGYADPRLMVRSILAAYRNAGGAVLQAPVASLVPGKGGWSVRTAAGAVACGKVLVAAGAASPGLLPDPTAVPAVRAAAAHVGVFPGSFGPAPAVVDLAHGLLVRPGRGGLLGSLRGTDTAETFCDSLRRAAGVRVPGLVTAGPRLLVTADLDDTPDGRPLVGAVEENLFVACGFGGKGFKLAPALTAALADHIRTGLRPGRLAAFDPLRDATACGDRGPLAALA
jgi:glycine/D-amino acid oxidase-like deaminating enzyme